MSMNTINGFEYPLIDGYTIKVSMRTIGEMKRAFPARMVQTVGAPKDTMLKNIDIHKWNKEHPEEQKPFLFPEPTMQNIPIPAGTPNFEDAAECCKAYVIIINNTPEAKNGTMPKVDLEEMLDNLDKEDHEELIDKLVLMLEDSRKKSGDSESGKN